MKNLFSKKTPRFVEIGCTKVARAYSSFKQACKNLLNTEIDAFTLSEALITLAILGALFVILVPLIKGARPDEQDAMKKKATFVVERIVSELAADEHLYPRTDDGYNGLANTSAVVFNGKTYGGIGDEGPRKFCKLFASRLNLKPGTEVQCPPTEPNKPSATTMEGMEWYLPITNFQSGSATIKVDINGNQLNGGKGPDAPGEDILEFKVNPGFHVEPKVKPDANAAGRIEAPPTLDLDGGGESPESKEDERKKLSTTCILVRGSTTGANVIGTGCDKVPGEYVVVAIPNPGWKCDWFTQHVTIKPTADNSVNVELPELNCTQGLETPSKEDDENDELIPEPPEEEPKTYCINYQMTGESAHCTVEGAGCGKTPGELYTVTISSDDSTLYAPSISSRTIRMPESDYELGMIECAMLELDKCYNIVDKRSDEQKRLCSVNWGDGDCTIKGRDDANDISGLFEDGNTYTVTVTPKDGAFVDGNPDPVDVDIVIDGANFEITDENLGVTCSDKAGAVTITIESVLDPNVTKGDTGYTAGVNALTSVKASVANEDIPHSVSVGLSASYESCFIYEGELQDNSDYLPADVSASFSVGSTNVPTQLLGDSRDGLCGNIRNRQGYRLSYPEAWTIDIGGTSHTIEDYAEITVEGTVYTISNTGLPTVDYDCPCEGAGRGKIRVTAFLDAEGNDSVQAVTIPYEITEQGGPSDPISDSLTTTPNKTVENIHSVFPSTYDIAAGEPSYDGDNDKCQMEMEGPTPASVTVEADKQTDVTFKFKCGGACIPSKKYTITVNESLDGGGALPAGKTGWSGKTTDLSGGSDASIDFTGIDGYTVKSIKISKEGGESETLAADTQVYMAEICSNWTIDIVYNADKIELVAGSLSATYPPSNDNTGTTPSASVVGNTIEIKTWQDVSISGISVKPSNADKNWDIRGGTGFGGDWSVTPTSGKGNTGLTLTVPKFHTSGGCFKACYQNTDVCSNEMCFVNGEVSMGKIEVELIADACTKAAEQGFTADGAQDYSATLKFPGSTKKTIDNVVPGSYTFSYQGQSITPIDGWPAGGMQTISMEPTSATVKAGETTKVTIKVGDLTCGTNGNIEVYAKADTSNCSFAYDAQAFDVAAKNTQTGATETIYCSGNPSSTGYQLFCSASNIPAGSYNFSIANFTGIAGTDEDNARLKYSITSSGQVPANGTLKIYYDVGCDALADGSIIIELVHEGPGDNEAGKSTSTVSYSGPESGSVTVHGGPGTYAAQINNVPVGEYILSATLESIAAAVCGIPVGDNCQAIPSMTPAKVTVPAGGEAFTTLNIKCTCDVNPLDYNVIVQHYEEDTNKKIAEDVDLGFKTAGYGGEHTCQDIEGYTSVSGSIPYEVKDQDLILSCYYKKNVANDCKVNFKWGRIPDPGVSGTLTISGGSGAGVKSYSVNSTTASDFMSGNLACGQTYSFSGSVASGYTITLEPAFYKFGDTTETKSVYFNIDKDMDTTYEVTAYYYKTGTTTPVKDPVALRSRPNGEYDYTCPSVTGYTNHNATASYTVNNANASAICYYDPAAYTVTAYYYKTGTTTAVKNSASIGSKSNGTYSYTCPAVTGYTAKNSSVSYTVNNANASAICYYDCTPYAVTAYYKYGSTNVQNASSLGTKCNGSYSYTCPTIAGYSANSASVSYSVSNAAASVTCNYTPGTYTVTAYYYKTGTTTAVKNSASIGSKSNGTYSYTCPSVTGYTNNNATASYTVNNGNASAICYYDTPTYTVTAYYYKTGTTTAVKNPASLGSKANGTYSYTCPSVSGYSNNNSTASYTVSNAAASAICYYDCTPYAVTATYKSGSTAIKTAASLGTKCNGTYSYSCPAITGYTANNSSVSYTVSNAAATAACTYSAASYTVTAYYYKTGTTTAVKAAASLGTKTNGTYSYTCPTITGYTNNNATASYTVNNGNASAICYYNTPSYTVTTYYQNESGTSIKTATTATVSYGGSYTFSCSAITGYTVKTTPAKLTNITSNKSGTCVYEEDAPVETVTITYTCNGAAAFTNKTCGSSEEVTKGSSVSVSANSSTSAINIVNQSNGSTNMKNGTSASFTADANYNVIAIPGSSSSTTNGKLRVTVIANNNPCYAVNSSGATVHGCDLYNIGASVDIEPVSAGTATGMTLNQVAPGGYKEVSIPAGQYTVNAHSYAHNSGGPYCKGPQFSGPYNQTVTVPKNGTANVFITVTTVCGN